ncbi:cobyric acid synthase [Thalassotalea agarivorans]|uniref:Cobyric acid synthase n=1 Tax=Thalassotalea agarivorans TaxID=349064 RepID=A0A1I0G849_THASX|nr:cobyric acid synthase [Thalassotalea agarivorans]SET66880.1 adenosylcobyric acid synthase (glutamine-hydrolysing) [Thalassotalea agarivorans]
MKTLMVQGTTSDAGKSTLVAALCRIFADLNYKVAPFKPQNMALNSAVTDDGGEIGRAQALQASAARVSTSVHFNPILLKPNSDTGAQVIVQGKALSNMEAASYQDYKKVAMEHVLDSFETLAQRYDYCFVEGAGSPAEINLREGDIANMGFAEEVDCPVIIIADIDKGGVFAHLVGTLALLSESEQQRVAGFVINRFRGDITLLQSGLDWLEQKTGKPVLGVLPYLHNLALDAEDAVNIENIVTEKKISVAVLLLPHISNHTDFDALRLNPSVDLTYVQYQTDIPACDLIIVPGSKNVISDYAFLTEQQWHLQIKQHLRYGGKVLGICGGLQMLGEQITDPHAVESHINAINTLGLAPFKTELTQSKQLEKRSGVIEGFENKSSVTGYEIHCGISKGEAFNTPFIRYNDNGASINEGFFSADNQIAGTYWHGLFDQAESSEAVLQWVLGDNQGVRAINLDEVREQQIDRLATSTKAHLDINKLHEIMDSYDRKKKHRAT